MSTMLGIRALRKAERPGQILDAAFDEFVAKGYAAARLDDVAARIGVTKGTIYFYFDSKENLFEAALEAVAKHSWAEMQRREVRSTGDLMTDIRLFLEDLLQFVVNNRRSRESFRLLVAEGGRFPDLVDLYFRSFMQPIEESLRQRLGRALRAHEIRPGLDHLTEVVLSPPLALQVMLLLFPDRLPVDGAAFLRSHVEALTAGILAPRPESRLAPKLSDASIPDAVNHLLPLSEWTAWKPFPDPRHGEMLTAPIGPGLWACRVTDAEPLFTEAAQSVAARLTEVATGKAEATRGLSSALRKALVADRAALQYRTLVCRSHAEAQKLAKAIRRKPTAV